MSAYDFNFASTEPVNTALWDSAYFLSGNYGVEAIREEEELTLETRELLAEICESVSEILPTIEEDFGDFAADLEEMTR